MFEYVGGGSLTDWVHHLAAMPAGRRSKQVLAALGQLTEAVATFHTLDRPIVHRDLKPSNVLLDKATKRLRITDFGIGSVTARESLREEARGTSTRGGRLQTYLQGAHTPLYASPQQRAGATPDPRDDIHALGVIAYQMLTGHLAQGAGPDFADDLRDAGATEQLIALLGRCVAQKPERRPKDARELLEHLNRLHPPAVRPAPIPSVPSPPPPPTPASFPDIDAEVADYENWLLSGREPTTWLADRQARGNRWKEAALTGHAGGAFLLGCHEGSLSWLRKAADAGHPLAMYAVGVVYENNPDMTDDPDYAYDEAMSWYERAAQAGCPAGMRNLGRGLLDGVGGNPDHPAAISWLTMAAERGDTRAMTDLGQACADGRGIAAGNSAVKSRSETGGTGCIPVRCIGCTSAFDVPTQLGGKMVRCVKCKTIMQVPVR